MHQHGMNGAAHSPQAKASALTLGALGVVFGDIGTSPLYALRECFGAGHGVPLGPEAIVGVVSLILWSILLVVTLKYLTYVMRADNRGGGGILALMALADRREVGARARRLDWIVALGLMGAALLYGDAVITPAISVLSAIEGLHVATPVFKPYVIWGSVLILTGVFWVQSRGTHRLGAWFGPVMCVWFATLAALGIHGIRLAPEVLAAFNPAHAVGFLLAHSWKGFSVLGSVFLAVTGGEALYADMGHFGRRPIRIGWYVVALPSLMLQYLGQGGLLMKAPAAVENPFYHLAPAWMQLPLVALATCATIIASQAMVTGAFSLTHQAIQLGYLPRFNVIHTSSDEENQIYVPLVNWLLFLSTTSLVLGFGSSSRLAGAYGIAVTGTMVVTTLLMFVVARARWNWSLPAALGVTAFFLVPDLAFLAANSLKIWQGGWLPLLMGGGVYFIMITWKRGRALVVARKARNAQTLGHVMSEACASIRARVPGTAVFMSEALGMAPSALLQNVRHNHVLHEKVILITVQTRDVPFVDEAERIEQSELGEGFYRVIANYGFMEAPDVPKILSRCDWVEPGEPLIYFFSADDIVATALPGMALWRERIYVFLARNSRRTSFFFRVPSEQVVQLGERVDL